MRLTRTSLLSLMMSALILTGISATPAAADGCSDSSTNWCGKFVAKNPGDPGNDVGSADSGSPCKYNGAPISCDYGDFKWSNVKQCYYGPEQFHKRSGEPYTDEEYAEKQGRPGQVSVRCYVLGNGSSASSMFDNRFWVAAEDNFVDPAQLAQQAVAQMGLRAPEIGMTGGSPPDEMQIVGMPAWLWAADPGESTTPGVGGVEPIVRSASAGGITVTATGRLDRTVWAMGDGAAVTCSGVKAAGTPWEARYDKAPSPTCGYTYTRTSAGQPNKAYTVTVTAYWVVNWSGGNQSGTINVQRSRSIPKQVGELQALIVQPG